MSSVFHFSILHWPDMYIIVSALVSEYQLILRVFPPLSCVLLSFIFLLQTLRRRLWAAAPFVFKDHEVFQSLLQFVQLNSIPSIPIRRLSTLSPSPLLDIGSVHNLPTFRTQPCVLTGETFTLATHLAAPVRLASFLRCWSHSPIARVVSVYQTLVLSLLSPLATLFAYAHCLEGTPLGFVNATCHSLFEDHPHCHINCKQVTHHVPLDIAQTVKFHPASSTACHHQPSRYRPPMHPRADSSHANATLFRARLTRDGQYHKSPGDVRVMRALHSEHPDLPHVDVA